MQFFTTNHQNQSRSILPSVLEHALLQLNQSDGFCDAVTFAAEQADCEFLFEVPGSLFDQIGGRAAVIRSRSDKGLQEKCILYVIFDGEDGIIRILEEYEVPSSVQAMTQSYSTVLELMAKLPKKQSQPFH